MFFLFLLFFSPLQGIEWKQGNESITLIPDTLSILDRATLTLQVNPTSYVFMEDAILHSPWHIVAKEEKEGKRVYTLAPLDSGTLFLSLGENVAPLWVNVEPASTPFSLWQMAPLLPLSGEIGPSLSL